MPYIKYYQMARVVEEVHFRVTEEEEATLLTMTTSEVLEWLTNHEADEIQTDEICEVDAPHMWRDSTGKEYNLE